MKISLDAITVTLTCPKCGKQLKEQVGRLKRDKHIACPTCGRIDVNTDQLRRVEADAGKMVDQELAKLGRKKITLKF